VEPSVWQLRGDQSSDEIRTPANSAGQFASDQQQSATFFRPGGSANRAWDLDEWMWDSRGNLDVRGLLPPIVRIR
jgi:hypothetical protein